MRYRAIVKDSADKATLNETGTIESGIALGGSWKIHPAANTLPLDVTLWLQDVLQPIRFYIAPAGNGHWLYKAHVIGLTFYV